MILVSHNYPAIVRNPCEGSFHYISSPVSIPEPVVLSVDVPMILAMRYKKNHPSFFQSSSGRVTVIGFVADDPCGPGPWSSGASFGDFDFPEDFVKKSDFSRRGRVEMAPERDALAINQYQTLCSFAPFGLPDPRAPFFAGKKVPSTNVSFQSRLAFSSSSERKARHRFLKTSLSHHSLIRRQQVEGLGYRSGRSLHLAPVFSTQSMPSRTNRSSARGRPPLGLAGGFGIRGWIFAHCASVNITSRALIGLPPKSALREKP